LPRIAMISRRPLTPSTGIGSIVESGRSPGLRPGKDSAQ
jgi:hypothetical protein